MMLVASIVTVASQTIRLPLRCTPVLLLLCLCRCSCTAPLCFSLTALLPVVRFLLLLQLLLLLLLLRLLMLFRTTTLLMLLRLLLLVLLGLLVVRTLLLVRTLLPVLLLLLLILLLLLDLPKACVVLPLQPLEVSDYLGTAQWRLPRERVVHANKFLEVIVGQPPSGYGIADLTEASRAAGLRGGGFEDGRFPLCDPLRLASHDFP